jgi:hypothetical protein
MIRLLAVGACIAAYGLILAMWHLMARSEPVLIHDDGTEDPTGPFRAAAAVQRLQRPGRRRRGPRVGGGEAGMTSFCQHRRETGAAASGTAVPVAGQTKGVA